MYAIGRIDVLYILEALEPLDALDILVAIRMLRRSYEWEKTKKWVCEMHTHFFIWNGRNVIS